jgi:hypothetical protein
VVIWPYTKVEMSKFYSWQGKSAKNRRWFKPFIVTAFLVVISILYLAIQLVATNNTAKNNYDPSLPSPSISLIPSQSYDAIPADDELRTEVEHSVAIIDSYSIGHESSFYQINVLVSKAANIIPVGIQLVDPNGLGPIRNEGLRRKAGFFCFRSYLMDQKGNKIYDLKDPYTDYDKGNSIAYETEVVHDSQSNDFASIRRKLVNLIVAVGEKSFVVEGLEVTGKCTWTIE